MKTKERTGDDVVQGGTGNDIVYGMGGEDYIEGGAGADGLNGDASICNPSGSYIYKNHYLYKLTNGLPMQRFCAALGARSATALLKVGSNAEVGSLGSRCAA